MDERSKMMKHMVDAMFYLGQGPIYIWRPTQIIRSRRWIYTFLTHRKVIQLDQEDLNLLASFNISPF
jgi:hypothetical protein